MPAKQLHRSRKDSTIAGVCGGLAEYFEVDPVLVRLGAVGLTVLAPPAGLVGYLTCWLVLPEEPSTAADASTTPPHAGTAGGTPEPSPAPETSDRSAEPGPHTSPESSAEPPSSSPQQQGRPGGAGESATTPTGQPPLHGAGKTSTASARNDSNPGFIGGMILAFIGLFFLMINLDLFDWGFFRFLRWRYIWPTVIIAAGVWMITRGLVPSAPSMREREHRS